MKPDGHPGITMQDWLIEHGLEGPKVRPPPAGYGAYGDFGSTLDSVRRRHNAINLLSKAGDGGGGGRRGGGGSDDEGEGKAMTGGTRTHRPTCMCIICKQARGRGGGGWAALATGPAGDGGRAAALLAARHLRSGKRAYVQAMPQFLSSLTQHR